jgi:transcriptional regulator with XRE-family HTH domain
VTHLPAIVDFLGYAPWKPPEGFGAWFRQLREVLGLSRKKVASRLEIDESTVAGWERQRRRPPYASAEKIRLIFDLVSIAYRDSLTTAGRVTT